MHPSPPSREDAPLLLMALAFVAVYVIWGSTYLAIRIGIETIPPFLMAGSRFLVAGAPLVLLALARGAQRPTASQWRAAALVGVLMLVGGNGLVTWAEQTILSSVAAVLIALVPLWMALFDRVLFRGPRLGPSAVSARSLLALGYLALFGSIVALSAYLWLLRTTTAAAVSTYAFVNPVVAVLLGWLFGGEHLDGRALVAASLIVSAVLCLYRVRARPRPRERPPAAADGLPSAPLTSPTPTPRS